MRVSRRSLAFVLMLPVTGCVFAVGSDDDGTEALRDRVRALEKRVDRMEQHPAVVFDSGRNAKVYKVIDGKVIQEEPADVEAPKEPK
jgi:hypothetical protein